MAYKLAEKVKHQPRGM